jgi:hypothetical protein
MTLAAGARLGAYEISSLVGVGGMGEVYRARDTRLNRNVAIKVLPDHFTGDAERLARFKREAHVLASLNHPNIAAIYGVEDRPAALVLELVEGPTLADLIAKGRIPIDDALPVAWQIAEALEAAHEQGIVHCDLKPANIKLTPDGRVKVLDFAKALDRNEGLPGAGHASDMTVSPTITSPAMTMGGFIVGTAAYMSPEQTRGKPVDKRTDIWSFGCVLFEMLASARPFEGTDVSDVLAAVIRAEPDWMKLPENTPKSVRTMLRRCLQKDKSLRLRDAGDIALEIREAQVAGTAATGSPTTGRTGHRLLVTGLAAAVSIAALLAAGLFLEVRRRSPESLATRFSIAAPDGCTLAPGGRAPRRPSSNRRFTGRPPGRVRGGESKGRPTQATGAVDAGLSRSSADGRYFFSMVRELDRPTRRLIVRSSSNEEKVLLEQLDTGPFFLSQGHVLFVRSGALLAQQIDERQLEMSGDVFVVAEGISNGNLTPGRALFSVSENGVLAYRTSAPPADSRLVWLDRPGRPIGILADQAPFNAVELSPDGRHAAVSVMEPRNRSRNLWLYDTARGRDSNAAHERRGNGRGVVSRWQPSRLCGSITAWKYASDSKADQ